MKKILALCFLAILGLTLGSEAALDRTFITNDDTLTTEQGMYQVSAELAYFTKGDAYELIGYDISGTDVLLGLKYGVLGNMDVSLQTGYTSQKEEWTGGDASESGLSDTLISGKYRFLDETTDSVGIAVSCGVKVATADEDKGLGSGEMDFGLNAILSKVFGDTTGTFNLGYTVLGEPEGASYDNIVSYGAEVVHPVGVDSEIGIAIAGKTAPVDALDNSLIASIGAKKDVNGMEVFGSIGKGFNDDDDPDYAIQIGVRKEL